MLLEVVCCLSFVFSLYTDYRLKKISKNVKELVKSSSRSKLTQDILDDPLFKDECIELIRKEGLQQLREKIEIGYYSRLADKAANERFIHHELLKRERNIMACKTA